MCVFSRIKLFGRASALTLVTVPWLFACSAGSGSQSSTSQASLQQVLDWVIPVARQDGMPLPLEEISGYRVYMGNNSQRYTDIVEVKGNLSTMQNLDALAKGVYYFSVTTIDKGGRESLYSNEVEVSI